MERSVGKFVSFREQPSSLFKIGSKVKTMGFIVYTAILRFHCPRLKQGTSGKFFPGERVTSIG